MQMEKIKLNKDFRRLYGRGKSYVDKSFVAYVLPNGHSKVRFGVTVSKKLGNAVKRNRAKRLLTAAMRSQSGVLSRGCDVVLVARSRIFSKKSTEIAEKLGFFLTELGLTD